MIFETVACCVAAGQGDFYEQFRARRNSRRATNDVSISSLFFFKFHIRDIFQFLKVGYCLQT